MGSVDVVDLRTRPVHLLTPEAAAAGRQADGRYLALRGDVLPASLIDPGQGYCWSCRSTSTVPSQRSPET